MDAISTAELLEIAMLLRDDLEDQFQFWLSITFAVIVASFIAGDRLRFSWRTIVGTLYLLATVLFAVRLSESAQNLMLYLTPALERGAEHPLASAFQQFDKGTLLANDIETEIGIGVSGFINDTRYWLGAPDQLAEHLPSLPAYTSDHNQQRDARVLLTLTTKDEYLATFSLSDTLRPEVSQVLSILRKQDK